MSASINHSMNGITYTEVSNSGDNFQIVTLDSIREKIKEYCGSSQNYTGTLENFLDKYFISHNTNMKDHLEDVVYIFSTIFFSNYYRVRLGEMPASQLRQMCPVVIGDIELDPIKKVPKEFQIKKFKILELYKRYLPNINLHEYTQTIIQAARHALLPHLEETVIYRATQHLLQGRSSYISENPTNFEYLEEKIDKLSYIILENKMYTLLLEYSKRLSIQDIDQGFSSESMVFIGQECGIAALRDSIFNYLENKYLHFEVKKIQILVQEEIDECQISYLVPKEIYIVRNESFPSHFIIQRLHSYFRKILMNYLEFVYNENIINYIRPKEIKKWINRDLRRSNLMKIKDPVNALFSQKVGIVEDFMTLVVKYSLSILWGDVGEYQWHPIANV